MPLIFECLLGSPMTQSPSFCFHVPFLPLINLCILALLFLATERAFAADPFFEACSEHKYCGAQLISFPFYIERQQNSFCGYPGFAVSCDGGVPIIRLPDGNDYLIHDIFYGNQSLRVSNAAFSPGNETCIEPVNNMTAIPEEQFSLVSDHRRNVIVLYNCSTPSSAEFWSYRIGCSARNETESVLALYEGDPNLSKASTECRTAVAVSVEATGGEGVLVKLERGVMLKWTASNCSFCEDSGGRCGFNESTYHFLCFCPDRPHAWQCTRERKAKKDGLKLGLSLGLGASVMVIGLLVVMFFVRGRRLRKRFASSSMFSGHSSPGASSKSDLESRCIYYGVPVFSYRELEEATHFFDHSRELGDGGFGTVYYGKLQDGREVAVKRLYQHNYRRVEQFMNEIEILTRLRHKNLVSLYGCTSRRSRELLLVYEFIPNGTVADHIHGDRARPGSPPWAVRMSIAVETASALAYLHSSDIIHRDVKTNNILLDNNFCVKVADFGLSRLFPNDVTHVSTAPQGTPGYVDPEYHQCYQLTSKSDVYSFGVVLVELISSMPAVDITRHRQEINLANLAVNRIQSQALDELFDASLGLDSDSSIRKMMTMVAELAFQCLQQDRELRPSMDEVLHTLIEIQSAGKHQVENSDAPQPAHSPECDEVGLLKKSPPPSSPVSVTQPWVSRSTTPSSSA